MHHDKAVAVLDGVLHVVGDHHGGQVVLLNDLRREGQHLEGGLGVEGGGVLVQQQELGLVHGGHQEGQRLTLAAGQQAHTGGQTVLEAQIEALEQFTVLLPLRPGDADAESTGLAAAGGKGEVLFDLHGGGSAGHGVLKDAANVGGALMLAQTGDVHAVDDDLAAVHGPDAGDGVQHGRLACTVAADDGDEVALIQLQVQAVQGRLLVDGACVEGLGNILYLKHCLRPPCLPFWPQALRNICPSSTARRGRQPRQMRSAALAGLRQSRGSAPAG